jgi:flagellin
MGNVASIQSTSVSYGDFASGKRINSAADDAAGLAISEKMEAQSNGLRVGAENAGAGKNALQVAEGAMNEMQESLQRIRELGLKAANGLTSDDDKQIYQKEIDLLKKGLEESAVNTQFNEKKLLDGSMADMQLATNPDGSGMKIRMENATLESLGIADFDVTGEFDLEAIDNAMNRLSEARSNLGSSTNRLEHTIGYNNAAAIEQTSSQSRIEDLDVPQAISELKKNELLDDYQNMMLRKQMDDESRVAQLFQFQ